LALAADAVDDAQVFSGKFERAISIYRCAYSWVSHARPAVDHRLGVVWFGQYAPHASGASAVYVGAGAVPKVYGVGSLYAASLDASYWVHAVLGNWCDRFYVHTIGDIRAKQAELEGHAFAAQVGGGGFTHARAGAVCCCVLLLVVILVPA
jgi:dipeptidase